MLEVSKNLNVNGVVKIEDKPVVYLNASIDSINGAGANINRSIVNQDLYSSNKVEIRSDINKFQQMVYDLEDEMLSKGEDSLDPMVSTTA